MAVEDIVILDIVFIGVGAGVTLYIVPFLINYGLRQLFRVMDK